MSDAGLPPSAAPTRAERMQDIRDRWNEHVAPSVHARIWPTWPRLDQNQTFDQGKADIDWLLAEIGKLEAAASREGGSSPDALVFAAPADLPAAERKAWSEGYDAGFQGGLYDSAGRERAAALPRDVAGFVKYIEDRLWHSFPVSLAEFKQMARDYMAAAPQQEEREP